jgi:hypothetical protein
MSNRKKRNKEWYKLRNRKEKEIYRKTGIKGTKRDKSESRAVKDVDE